MGYILQAFIIALLVIVGLAVALYIWSGTKIPEREYKSMNKKERSGKIMKWIGGFGCILGGAFFFGSFQAYAQGFSTQIVPLGVIGGICIISGSICLIAGIIKKNKHKE